MGEINVIESFFDRRFTQILIRALGEEQAWKKQCDNKKVKVFHRGYNDKLRISYIIRVFEDSKI
jgi:hypothetical protein